MGSSIKLYTDMLAYNNFDKIRGLPGTFVRGEGLSPELALSSPTPFLFTVFYLLFFSILES